MPLFFVIRHRRCSFSSSPPLSFFLSYTLSKNRNSAESFSSFPRAFVLSAFLARNTSGTAIGLSLPIYLPPSYVSLVSRTSSLSLCPSYLLLFTSFYSSISRKSTALSARRSTSTVLFQAAVETTFFLWSLGFYSVSCLQLARSPSLIVASPYFSLSLSRSLLNPFLTLLRRVSPFPSYREMQIRRFPICY